MVIDASVTLAWYVEDESTPTAEEVLVRVAESGAMVPSLWRLEVANDVQTAIRRTGIDAHCRDAPLNVLALLPIAVGDQQLCLGDDASSRRALFAFAVQRRVS